MPKLEDFRQLARRLARSLLEAMRPEPSPRPSDRAPTLPKIIDEKAIAALVEALEPDPAPERAASLAAGGADPDALLFAAALMGERALVGAAIRGAWPIDPRATRSTLGDSAFAAGAWSRGFFESGAGDALIAAGFDIDQRNAAGQTPLLSAAGLGKADLAQRLLERGADPNATGKIEGRLANRLIACGARDALCDAIAAGADLSLADSDGRTALNAARERDQKAPHPAGERGFVDIVLAALAAQERARIGAHVGEDPAEAAAPAPRLRRPGL